MPAPYQAINLWYGHPKTHVLLVDTDLPAGEKTNTQPYKGRGWCVMEYRASSLVKVESALISLKGLTGEEEDLNQVRKNGMAARPPPVAPAEFASTLEAGVASGITKFTNSGDVGLVGKIYGWAFAAEMAGAVSLSYCGLGWDDAQMLALCEVLRAAHAGSGLGKVESLNLARNKMGDGSMAALAALLEEGAMPNLEELILAGNQISDAGMAALASAVQGGALQSCTRLDLDDNQISDAGVAALATAVRAGALPSCSKYNGPSLGGNPGCVALVDKHGKPDARATPCPLMNLMKEALASPQRAAALAWRQDMSTAVKLSYASLGWDDAQMLTLCEALRAAHAGGGLRKLEELELDHNKMGDGAAAALAALVEEGAMPNLKKLYLHNNQISDAGMAALASALRGGALPSCTGIYLHDNPGSDAPVDEALASPERAAALARRQDE